MKKKIRKIFIGLICMILCWPMNCYADMGANFGVKKDEAIFRLKSDFEADADFYMLLVFARTEFKGKKAWVYVFSKEYSAENLKTAYVGKWDATIEGVPFVEKAALKLFANKNGKWRDCFGLCEGSGKFDETNYEVVIKKTAGNTETESESDTEESTETEPESDTEESTETEPESDTEESTEREPESDTEESTEREPESDTEESTETEPESDTEESTETEPESAAVQNLENASVYIMADEEDRTILPLSLAEKLYGFDAELLGNAIKFYGWESADPETTEVFVCEKENDSTVLTEIRPDVEFENRMSWTETEDQTETETGETEIKDQTETGTAGTETEEQTETAGTETEIQSETEMGETGTEEQSETETAGTETEEQSGTTAVAEIKNQGETETAGTEAEEQSETEAAGTETENQAETEAAETETERRAETETAGTETESRSETETAGTETENRSETETAGTETESQSETETAGTEAESRSETETAGTETEIQTETEVDETEEQTEEESLVTGTEAPSKPDRKGHLPILLAGIFMLLAAAAILVVLRRKGSGKTFFTSDDEATVDLTKGTSAARDKLTIQAAVINDKGRVRGNNEDNFYFNGVYMQRDKMDNGASITNTCRDSVQLYAVCDGMGGTDCGEEASHKAVEELALKKQEHPRMTYPRELTEVLRNISESIYEESVQKSRKSGTTIAMMLIRDGQALAANVGDSRIYCMRNGKLSQVSRDHSKVQRMISMGLLTPEQAKKDPNRHVITQYLGMPTDVKVSPYMVENVELRKNDVYVLCSDGLTDMVDDKKIEEILKQNKKPQSAAQELFRAAMNNGGRDNITIIVLRV